MEKQLFNWQEWDQIDTMVFQFENVRLQIPVGPFAIGSAFAYAVLDYDKGTLVLGHNENDEHKFNLGFVITEA